MAVLQQAPVTRYSIGMGTSMAFCFGCYGCECSTLAIFWMTATTLLLRRQPCAIDVAMQNTSTTFRAKMQHWWRRCGGRGARTTP